MCPPGKQIVPPAATVEPRRIARNRPARCVIATTPNFRGLTLTESLDTVKTRGAGNG